MSDVGDIDVREQLTRIDRAIAETRKLQDESDKFRAEQRKLMAEAEKLTRERVLAPWLASAAVIGGFLGLLTFAARLLGH